MELVIDGVKFGRLVACREKPEGLELEGTGAVRTMVGRWSAEFSYGEPRRLLIRKLE
jgi:hypothetical protein